MKLRTLLLAALFGLAACEAPISLIGPDDGALRTEFSPQSLVVDQVEVLPAPEGFTLAQAVNRHGLAVGVTGSAAQARATLWEAQGYLRLPSLGGSGAANEATGVNSRREVVGFAWVSGMRHPTHWSPGGVGAILPFEGFEQGVANDVNDSGVIVGWVLDRVDVSTTQRLPAVWRGPGEEVRFLATLFYAGSAEARSVNNRGQIAGVGGIEGGGTRAAVWDGPVPTALHLPDGFDNSSADAINELGAVAGRIVASGAPRATYWPDGADGDAIVLDPRVGMAHGLNNLGQVVGFVSLSGVETPALFMDDEVFPLPWPSLINGAAYAINDDGVVVGSEFTEVTSTPRSFRWQVPVRASIAVDPGSATIRASGGGKVTVVVYGSPYFSVQALDAATLTLGDESGSGTPVLRNRNGRFDVKYQDVDRDGHTDLVLAFDRRELVANGDLHPGSERLVLVGRRLDGRPLRGVGAVNVVP